MKTKRRQSRETAFYLIFEWGFREEESLDEIISQAEVGRSIVIDDFARTLAGETIKNDKELDALIERYSQKWKLNRIPKVTLALLRMSFCELSYFSDIPVGATINEAVELAKKYASDEDASYLNGILGQFERDRSGTEPLPSEENEASVEQTAGDGEI